LREFIRSDQKCKVFFTGVYTVLFTSVFTELYTELKNEKACALTQATVR